MNFAGASMQHKQMTRAVAAAIAAMAAMVTVTGLSACSGDEGPQTVSGTLLDSAVAGVAYQASPSGKQGTTDAGGHFVCQMGDTVTFTLGSVVLGKATCAVTVTPLELAGVSSWTGEDDKVNNRLLFLQSLDEDDDPANGIVIPSALASSLNGKSLDFNRPAANFDMDLAALLPALTDKFGQSYQERTPGEGRRKVAIEHFEGTLATQLGRVRTSNVIQASAGGEVALTKYVLTADASLFVPYEGSNAAAKQDFPSGFFPAVGSGLAFKGTAADGSLEFYGVTDRGPNGDSPNAPLPTDASKTAATKMFPAPSFTPSIGLISVGKAGARIQSLLPIRVDTDTKVNGRPLPAGTTGSTGEVPLTDALKFDASKANYDGNGLDTESLIYDAAHKVFWTSDEYGPFIVKIDAATGVILKKYQPGAGAADLPEVLKYRRANRGMEGLTLDASGKLHGFLQSPIDPLNSKGKSLETLDVSDLDQDGKKTDNVKLRDFAQFARWVVFDPVTETTRLYAYPLSYPLQSAGQGWDRNRTGSAKLGDVVALPNGKFLVIEQGSDNTGAVRNFLMLVELPDNATDIRADGFELEANSIDGSTATVHPWATVVPLKKTMLLDLNAAGWQAEKAEGLTLVDDKTIALINDNDFGLRTMLVDAEGHEIEGDITACTVDANGAILNDGNCPTGAVSGRVTRGKASERPTRLWLLQFPKTLVNYVLP